MPFLWYDVSLGPNPSRHSQRDWFKDPRPSTTSREHLHPRKLSWLRDATCHPTQTATEILNPESLDSGIRHCGLSPEAKVWGSVLEVRKCMKCVETATNWVNLSSQAFETNSEIASGIWQHSGFFLRTQQNGIPHVRTRVRGVETSQLSAHSA